MTDALVTIILPVHDYLPEYLEKSLGSVFGQTSPDWRLAIAIEESKKTEFENVLQAELKDPRVSLIVNQGAKFTGAINTAMRAATTEFVALLFADDVWSTEAIAVLNRNIREFPDADFFHSSRAFIDERGALVSTCYESVEHFKMERFHWGSPVKHLLCWRRALALKIGGIDESLGLIGPDDYDFPWTMAENGARFQAVRECLYLARNHCDYFRLTTHHPRWVHRYEVNRILRKHGVGWLRRQYLLGRRSWGGAMGGQSIYRSRIAWWLAKWRGAEPKSHWQAPKYR